MPAGMLFVDDAGPGRGHLPVLFIHSFGGSTAQWAPQLEHLRRTRRLCRRLRLTQRSCGHEDEREGERHPVHVSLFGSTQDWR